MISFPKIGQLENENEMLRRRLKELEGTAVSAMNEKKALKDKLDAKLKEPVVETDDSNDKVDVKEVEEMAEAFKVVKKQMASELEMNAKTQQEMEKDLSSTNHQLLDVRHQLNLAEKVSMKLHLKLKLGATWWN